MFIGPLPGRLLERVVPVPRAWVTAQARPSPSGRAGPGPVATVPCRARAGLNHRAMGRAVVPRATWLCIMYVSKSRYLVHNTVFVFENTQIR